MSTPTGNQHHNAEILQVSGAITAGSGLVAANEVSETSEQQFNNAKLQHQELKQQKAVNSYEDLK